MTETYPTFIPPAPLFEKRFEDFTRAEANRYFEWLMAIRAVRVDHLLRALGFDDDPIAVDLGALGERVASWLARPELSGSGLPGPRGMALGADVGLRLAARFEAALPDRLQWHIVWRPKNSIDYHQPVLASAKPPAFNPILVGVTLAKGISATTWSGQDVVEAETHWLRLLSRI